MFVDARTAGVSLGLMWLLSACGRIGVHPLPLDASTPEDTGAESDGSCVCDNAHGTADCSSGSCQLGCSLGYADCDGRPDNGCETSLSSDTSSCGTCGALCSGSNGEASCADGVCQLSCSSEMGDCDGEAQNGCEQPLTSEAHCGACAASCGNDHGTTACIDGSCVPECQSGYASCDGEPRNGCETNVARDPTHCGDCTTVCDVSTQVCTDGACVASMCMAGRADCDADRGDCETLLGTGSDCAFCDDMCSAANGSAACTAGTCTVSSCNAGFGNCDGAYQNGCETAVNTSVMHCGRCANPCTNAHGGVSCAAGTCAPTCSTGWGSCDNNPANGCETALNSVTHCGMCGRACTSSLGGATSSCNAGTCASTCLSGEYALRLAVNVNWSSPFIQSGSGTMVYWARLVLSQSGSALSGNVVPCGLSVPEFQNSLVAERYAITVPASAFATPAPSVAVTGTFTDGATPSFALNRTALLVGATLADPINASWPSLGSLDGADHDNDGHEGVAIDYRSGGGFAYPPTTAVFFPPPARARQSDLAARARFQLGSNLTSCTTASGSASVQSVDQHTLGCRLDGGGNCNSTQTQHLDDNDPQYTPTSASFSLSRLGNAGANVTCAAVRAALP